MPKLHHMLCVLFVATSIHTAISKDCQPIKIKHGLNVLNCSGTGLSILPDPWDDYDSAEVLDFSNNDFLQLPLLMESKHCDHESTTCQVINNTENTCRYDVSFSRNAIFSFHEHALHNVRCLRSLDLSYNEIRSSILTEQTFQEGFTKLQTLILRGNPLGKLPDNVITGPFLTQLRHIDLSHCQLTEIGENSVDDHSELLNLDLSNNELTELKSRTFKGLKKLRFLDLRHNKIQELGDIVFQDLAHLDSLLLAHNDIRSFGRHAFWEDTTLQTLDVSWNSLFHIPYHALQDLPDLSHLIVSHNPMQTVSNSNKSVALTSVTTLELEGLDGLTRLEKGALDSFPSLVTLSIRRNSNLNFIHPDFLGGDSAQLREVHLEYNELSTLHEDALPWKSLDVLRLEGNPWACDYRIEWMIKAQAIRPNTVKCDSPVQLNGRDIKTIDPSHLQRPFTVSYVIAVVILALTLPILAIVTYLCWRRRHHFRCCRGVQGRYVTVFTRDAEADGDDQVDIEVKIHHRRLKAVSNGGADDTTPFITMEHPHSINSKEEEEEEDV